MNPSAHDHVRKPSYEVGIDLSYYDVHSLKISNP